MDRYCRICYNTDGWCAPSGDAGILETGKSYANVNGFGHEEWLFDLTTLFKPSASSKSLFKYGYLQPIGKFRRAYIGDFHNLFLYAVTPQKERVAVAEIANAFVPEDNELKYVYERAIDGGLIEQMEMQVLKFRTDESDHWFGDCEPSTLFNVRFSVDDLTVFGTNEVLPETSPTYKLNRYHPLKKLPEDKSWIAPDSPRQIIAPVPPNASDRERSEAVRRKCAVMGTTFHPQHVILQNALYRHLQSVHGKASVFYERDYVDLTVVQSGVTIYFEIKIKASVRLCLREALGQLLEYSHYPNLSKAQRLTVVGTRMASSSDQLYLESLRARYNIPLYYRSWDAAKAALSCEN